MRKKLICLTTLSAFLLLIDSHLLFLPIVSADGQTPPLKEEKPPPQLQWRYPCFISSYTTDFSKVSVEFTRLVVGVRAQDLTVNGSPATQVEEVTSKTFDKVQVHYTFSGYTLPKLGKVEVVLPSGNIKRTDNQASFEGASWICNLFDPQADDDGDGLSNDREINDFYSDPTKNDTDEDGLPDPYEVQHTQCLSVFINEALPQNNYGVITPGTKDSDSDRVSNLEEFKRGTDPCNP